MKIPVLRQLYLSKITYRALQRYYNKHGSNVEHLNSLLYEVKARVDKYESELKEAISNQTYATSAIRNKPDPRVLLNAINGKISEIARAKAYVARQAEWESGAEERQKADKLDRERLYKDKSNYTRLYDDGETDSSPFEHDTFMEMLEGITKPKQGSVYEISGRRFLCISPYASYGGGSLSLWAIEGDSAQLTLNHSGQSGFFAYHGSGYIVGKCIKVSKKPLGIIFQPQSAHKGWPDIVSRDDPKKIEARLIKFKNIGRYDRNFDWTWPHFHSNCD